MHGDVIPVIDVFFLSLYDLQFLLWIVDERAKFFDLAFAQGITEQLRHLTLDVTRGILDDVQESLMLTVNICEEMFRSLWQVEYGREVLNVGFCPLVFVAASAIVGNVVASNCR